MKKKKKCLYPQMWCVHVTVWTFYLLGRIWILMCTLSLCSSHLKWKGFGGGQSFLMRKNWKFGILSRNGEFKFHATPLACPPRGILALLCAYYYLASVQLQPCSCDLDSFYFIFTFSFLSVVCRVKIQRLKW